MSVEEVAAYLRNFAEINQVFIVEKPEEVWLLLQKSKKKFKKEGNTIWRVR